MKNSNRFLAVGVTTIPFFRYPESDKAKVMTNVKSLREKFEIIHLPLRIDQKFSKVFFKYVSVWVKLKK